MRQKFNGCTIDIRHVPSPSSGIVHTPESVSNWPLLGDVDNEFVIEPFAVEECGGGAARTTSSSSTTSSLTRSERARRIMRPAVAVPTQVTTSEHREASCCSARPLAIGVVFVSMSFALIYFLMIVPLTSGDSDSDGSSPMSTILPKPTATVTLPTVPGDYTSTVMTTTVDPLYPHIDDKHHRMQIPMIHIPWLYEVNIKFFLPWKANVSFGSDNFAVEGHVRMHFTSGGGSRILLHAGSELHIGECSVTDELGREIWVKHVGRGFSQVVDLYLSAEMIHGMNYTLDVAYKGHLSQSRSEGMFAAAYPFGNETRYVASTQLQPSDARTVFPCIDIPEVKAPFETTIIHPIGTTAVSNMMEKTSNVEGSWVTTSFHRTPPMSTYLFAFLVSDFPYLEKFTEKGVRIRVYVDPGKINASYTLLDSSEPLLDFYTTYFGLPYPLDKLDIVILPVLSVTAMENWGMVTVRQSEGLYLEGSFPVVQKHNVQEIIAHELAHQWFGNMVTMKWWNDLWLNEGFATMVGTRAVDFLENTTWRYRDTTAEMMCITLRADQSDNSIAVSANKEVDIMRHAELNPNQKTIVYKKSAIIIRMIERLIDEEVFREGLNRFISTFMHKNADHDDLFNVLAYVYDSSSGGHLTGQNFSLADVMNTWLRQAHFPIVHVKRIEGSIVTLQQERYIHLKSRDTREYVWKIPIFYDDPVSGKHKVFWITDKQPTVFDMGGQMVVDPKQLTYIRLKYDMQMYSDLTKKLLENFEEIPTNSRSRLIDDTHAMAEVGQISYKVALNMTMFLPREVRYRPFQTFSAYLDFFLPRMFSHEMWPEYQQYLFYILGKPFDRFKKQGFDGNMNNDVEAFNTREIVVYRACQIGYEPCIKLAKDLFAELRQSCSEENQLLSDKCNKIPLYLRQSIYYTAIEQGSQSDFDFLFRKFEKEHYLMERDRIWFGMCGTDSRGDNDRMWKHIIKNRAPENLKHRAVQCSKKITRDSFLLEFLMENPQLIEEIDEIDMFPIGMLAFRQLSTSKHIEMLTTYLQSLGKYGNRWANQIVMGKGRIAWREKYSAFVARNATEALTEMKRMNMADF